jgi:hypothetical protein
MEETSPQNPHSFKVGKQSGNNTTVSIEVDDDFALEEVLEEFESFLYAIGYRLPSGAVIGYEYEESDKE